MTEHPPTEPGDLDGKVIVVTGANSGIGLVSATEFASRGARVVMMCRSPERGAEAVTHITTQTGVTPELIPCDFSDMDQIRAAGREVIERHERLDVLLNNAGAYFPRRLESAQGLEMTFAVNHLGYFLLTHVLRSLLGATDGSRVVNVSSRAHAQGLLDFDDLQYERRSYRAMQAYGTSKLANILFTRELARRLEGTGTTTNCVHPGVIRSGFGRDEPGFMKWLVIIGSPFLQSPTSGARGNIHLSTSPDVADVSGEYFIGKKIKKSSVAGRDMEAAARLWQVSEALCGVA